MRKFKQLLENNSRKTSKNAETKVTASLVSMKPNEELGLKKLNLYQFIDRKAIYYRGLCMDNQQKATHSEHFFMDEILYS